MTPKPRAAKPRATKKSAAATKRAGLGSGGDICLVSALVPGDVVTLADGRTVRLTAIHADWAMAMDTALPADTREKVIVMPYERVCLVEKYEARYLSDLEGKKGV